MIKENGYNNALYIQTFGEFSLIHGDKTLSGKNIHSKKVWCLLEYLIANRYKENTIENLIDMLWDDCEIDNPTNALKNLAYRLRRALKEQLDIDSNEYIINKSGSYIWNINANYILDADILENSMKKIVNNELTQDEKLEEYLKAISVYKGNFMPQASYKEWAVGMSVYYQNLYMKAVKNASELLNQKRQFEKVEEICREAITIDPFIEVNHLNLLKALISTRNNKQALEHYNYITKIFYDEFGVSPSKEITDLYSKITEYIPSYEKNILNIKDDLKEDSSTNGTLVCNYETFRTIYRLQARSILRTGKTFFLLLITINPKERGKAYYDKNLSFIMDTVLLRITTMLRKDDVIARCGKNQFTIMLANINYENSLMVSKRVENKIYESNIGKYLVIDEQISSLDPLGLEEK